MFNLWQLFSSTTGPIDTTLCKNSDMYVGQCIPATQVDLYCNTLRGSIGTVYCIPLKCVLSTFSYLYRLIATYSMQPRSRKLEWWNEQLLSFHGNVVKRVSNQEKIPNCGTLKRIKVIMKMKGYFPASCNPVQICRELWLSQLHLQLRYYYRLEVNGFNDNYQLCTKTIELASS